MCRKYSVQKIPVAIAVTTCKPLTVALIGTASQILIVNTTMHLSKETILRQCVDSSDGLDHWNCVRHIR